MLKNRLIPVLLLENGQLVRSEAFRVHQIIGDPYHEVQRFNEWNVDELIYLDIGSEEGSGGRCDIRRDTRTSAAFAPDSDDPLHILDEVSRTCFMPLTWGGRIRSLDGARERITRGADKVTLCTAAWQQPALITEIARAYGSQAVVVCIDVRRNAYGRNEVFVEGGSQPTGLEPVAFARRCAEMGAGEILLQSIDRDGSGEGYDTALIAAVAEAVTLPVIALGGVGTFEHYAAGIEAGAAAVAAANIWHFKELSDRGGKRALDRAGVAVRQVWKG